MRKRAGGERAATGSGAQEHNVGWATLLVGLGVTGFLFWKNRQGMAFTEYYLLNTALLLGLPLLVVLLPLRREAADFGMTPGNVGGGLGAAVLLWALFLPVIWYVSPRPEFQEYYLRQLRSSGALLGPRLEWGGFFFHQTVLGFYMFGWEWYHRGFLLHGLRRLMPVLWAALFQACAFALLHYRKPPIEVASSFFGALLLAGVALRYRSFLPCFLLHWAISMSFDAAVLYHYLHR